MIHSKARPLLCALALAAAPLGSVAGQAPSPTASEPMMEEQHLSFAVVQDIVIAAPAATILALAQQPKRWSPNLIVYEHLAGPKQGVGALYRATTTVEGSTLTRTERTIVADDHRIVLHILTTPPLKGSTFIEIATLPEGKATRTSFKIYVDVESATEVPATMIPAIVKQNEAVLAGHLQRIKTLAEQPH